MSCALVLQPWEKGGAGGAAADGGVKRSWGPSRRAGAGPAKVPSVAGVEALQRQQAEDAEATGLTGSLVETMRANPDPKFQNSKFLRFVTRLNKGELVIEGNNVIEKVPEVDVANADAQSESMKANMITAANKRGRKQIQQEQDPSAADVAQFQAAQRPSAADFAASQVAQGPSAAAQKHANGIQYM